MIAGAFEIRDITSRKMKGNVAASSIASTASRAMVSIKATIGFQMCFGVAGRAACNLRVMLSLAGFINHARAKATMKGAMTSLSSR